MWKKKIGVTATIGLVAASVIVGVAPAHAAGSRLVQSSVPSASVSGSIDFTVYLPAGYDPSGVTRYASLYLLHGRGDTQVAWQQEVGDLDELIASGAIPPMIVVMPDAPWSNRGSYFVDSLYTGSAAGTTPGVAVETAFTTDLVDYIDATYRTIDDRMARAVGGYSMGGAGALRYATAHQEVFSAGIVLSPAVYVPSTPVDSSTREFGAYGVGGSLYVEARYKALNYPAGFAKLDASLPIHLFIAVGDDEYVNPKAADAIHDLDFEAATLYNRAKRVPGVTAELRVYDGGHDWGVWKQGFREGLTDLASYLQTEPPAPFDGLQFGSTGDDRAGGVIGRSDGSMIQAINAADSMLEEQAQGGFDIVVQKLNADRRQLWLTPIATSLNERAYGVVEAENGAVIIAGFMRQNHAQGENDDGLVVKLDEGGNELWRTTFGSEASADRVYGLASDGAGGAFVTGYTSGVIPGGANAGDKDAVVAHVDAAGAVVWATQFGSSGEDKGFAISVGTDGSVYVAGTAGGSMPGATSAGGYDGWVANFASDGKLQWLNQVGSSETDQVSALVATASGVAATGFTRGVVGAASAGDNDVFVVAMAADGSVQWTTQDGSNGDDRGASISTDAAGNLLVAGHTSGRLAGGAGGVDIFTLTLDPNGSVVERSQFGSPQRDGADEYDEANIFITGGGSTWIQGLTYGQVSGAVNVGAGDVFLTRVDFDTVLTSAPASGSEGDGAGTRLDSGGSNSASFARELVVAGVEVSRWAALAAPLLLAGRALIGAWFTRRRPLY